MCKIDKNVVIKMVFGHLCISLSHEMMLLINTSNTP